MFRRVGNINIARRGEALLYYLIKRQLSSDAGPLRAIPKSLPT